MMAGKLAVTPNRDKSHIFNQIDYNEVNQYWNKAESSILGPYMMDGFGFPPKAGLFRFQAEKKIVKRLIQGLPRHCMLDLGSGIGYWSAYFAGYFSKVISVEASSSLFNALEKRCAAHANITTIKGDVLSFEPEEFYSVVFLGGMLMYLNENDVIALLRKLTPFIEPGGVILCRETTVPEGTVIRNGGYHAVYRSIQKYRDIFEQCGLRTVKVEPNLPYILLQMGCESIKKWKHTVPQPMQILPVVGRLTYWGLRFCNPWITQVPAFGGKTFPELTNHFFLLRPE